MAIDINQLLSTNPSTVTDKCQCNQPGPCWLSANQEDGSGLNPDGTTDGTGISVEDLENGEASLNYPGITLLKVYHKEGTQSTYTIEFPKVPTAESYNLYGSPSPLMPELLEEGWVPADGDEGPTYSMDYDVEVPFTSTEIQWHFWVEAQPVENGKGGLISTTGASVWTSERDWDIPENQQINMPLSYPTTTEGTVIDNNYLDFVLQKNRSDKMMVLQADGEPFEVYLRRWEGIPCPCSDNRSSQTTDPNAVDLNYNSVTRCPYCFGTGFVGGYYHKIKILARYNSNPARRLQHTPTGILTTQQLNSWTLWTPLLRSHDILVQLSTGDRFYVQDVSRTIVKSYIMDQQFNNSLCQRSEVIYDVTNESIDKAFEMYSEAGTFKETDKIWG